MEIRKEKKERRKNTRRALTTLTCSLCTTLPLLNSELSDFHRGDITTDKPSTAQILPGSPRAWAGSHGWGWKQSWGCPCNLHKSFHTWRSKETAGAREQRQAWWTSSTQEGKFRSGKPRHYIYIPISATCSPPRLIFIRRAEGRRNL